jgi:SAM-dependent methyltransferase
MSKYKISHSKSGYGLRYNKNYSVGYYAALFKEVETPIISNIFLELSKSRTSILDFACGTGRITNLAPRYFSKVVGVDVSNEMLRNVISNKFIQYKCTDISQKPLNQKFDVISAFRFFLNAEPKLRDEALKAIRFHMAKDGRLICNIHMNSNSVMGIFYRITKPLKFLPKHNTMSLKQFEKTLNSNGFLIEKVKWYGFTPRPGYFLNSFFDKWLGPIERTFEKLGLQGRLSHSFIVIARIKDDKS